MDKPIGYAILRAARSIHKQNDYSCLVLEAMLVACMFISMEQKEWVSLYEFYFRESTKFAWLDDQAMELTMKEKKEVRIMMLLLFRELVESD